MNDGSETSKFNAVLDKIIQGGNTPGLRDDQTSFMGTPGLREAKDQVYSSNDFTTTNQAQMKNLPNLSRYEQKDLTPSLFKRG